MGANFEGNTHTFDDRVAVRKLLPVYGALLPRCRPTCVTSFPCTGGTPYNGASPPPIRSHEPFTIIRTFSRAGTTLVEQMGPRDFETALPAGTKISPNPKYSAYAGTAASGPKIKTTMATGPKPGRNLVRDVGRWIARRRGNVSRVEHISSFSMAALKQCNGLTGARGVPRCKCGMVYGGPLQPSQMRDLVATESHNSHKRAHCAAVCAQVAHRDTLQQRRPQCSAT